jgi:DNA-binding NarL/FixJ family response regulator
MTLKAILVEDSQTIRDNLIPALNDLAGVEVIAIAETEDDAVRVRAENPGWDLVIVDLFLREGTGLTVLRACEARQPHQHAIVLTNYPNPLIRERCTAIGADAIYDKSEDLEALFEHCLRYQKG